ncbi:MAG: hypothetical protein P1V51_23885, partial [Deltaproteobacteria bacterium]|nr:hypothetical protein [Deltaproteobacteria bacterium]
LPRPPLAYEPELYALDLSELSEADDEALAARFAEELFGGIDLEAARKAFVSPSAARAAEPRRHEAARNTLRRLRADAGELARDEEQLAALGRERDRALRATRELGTVEALLELLELRQGLAELRRQRASLEEGIEAVEEDAPARLASLRRARAEAEAALAETRGEVAQLEDDEAQAAFASEAPPAEAVKARRAEAEALRQRAGELERARAALEAAREDEAEMGRALFGPPPGESPEGPLKEEQVRKLHHALEELTGKLAEREGARRIVVELEQWLERDQEATRQRSLPEDVLALRQGSEALRDWLIVSPEPAGRGRGLLFVLTLLAGVGLGALLGAIFLGLRLPTLLGLLGGVIVLGGASFFLARWTSRPRDTGRRAALEEAATRAGVLPEAWTREAVTARLTEAWEALAGRQTTDEQLSRARLRSGDLDEAAAKLQDEAAETFLALGLSPELPALTAHERAQRIIRLVEARSELARQRQAVATLEGELESDRRALGGWLEGLGVELPGTAEGLVHCLEEVERRAGRLDDLRRQRREAERRLTRDGEALARREEELTAAWAGWGVAAGDEATLHRLASARPGLDALEEALRVAEGELARSEARLTDEALAPLGVDREAVTREQLETLKARLEGEAESLARVSDRISDIKMMVKQAGDASAMQEARAELHAASAALERARDEALARALADLFLVEARDAFVADHRPERLERACRLFADFTDHQWELQIDHVEGTFTALDTSQQLPRTLDELSSGTRVHLLLAARLAAIEAREKGGPALPLCLDELLSTTDPHRFEEVAGTLFELAAGGRQIFYFTAQPEELERWREAARRRGDEGEALLNTLPIRAGLVAEDWGEGRSIAPSAADALAPPAPPPGGDADAYARLLKIPRPEGHRIAEAWHLLHLLPDDLPAVHALLLQGVRTLGIWRSAWGDPGLPGRAPFLAPELPALLDLRGKLLEETLAAWRHGRGRPLCWRDVRESGAVSGALEERVRAIFEERGPDAEAFLAALEEASIRFNKKKQAQLRAHLLEQGVLSEDAPRPDETILAVVLARSSALLARSGVDEREAVTFVRHLLGLLSPLAPGPRQRALFVVEGGGDA